MTLEEQLEQLFQGDDREPASNSQAAAEYKARLDPDAAKKMNLWLQLQQRSANESRELANKYEAMPQQTDLSPLLGFVDGWAGTNYAKSYQRPETPQERMLNIGKLRQLAGKAQEDVLENQVKLLRGDNNDFMKLLAMQMRSGNDGVKQFQRMEYDRKREKDLEGEMDAIRKPISDDMKSLGVLSDAMGTGKIQDLNAVLAQFSRLISGEKGVLREEDIQRVFPSNINKSWAAVKQFFTDNPGSVEIDSEYSEGLRRLLAIAKYRSYKKAKDDLGVKRRSYSAKKSYQDLMAPGQSGDKIFRNIEALTDDLKGQIDPDGLLMSRPKEVTEQDWEMAAPEERKAMIEHFAKAKKK